MTQNSEHIKVDEVINDHFIRLLEVRETLAVAENAGEPNGSKPLSSNGNTPAVTEVSAGPAGLANNLARDLASCLGDALESMQTHLAGQTENFNVALQQKVERLQSTINDVKYLWGPVEQLLAAVADQRKTSATLIERFDQLTVTVGSLKESDARRNAEIEALRSENREVRTAIVAQVEELTALKTTATDATRRVAGIVEILDRQEKVLRELHQVETSRAAALERVFTDLTQAKRATAA
jgi:chromosome segregation ATPase